MRDRAPRVEPARRRWLALAVAVNLATLAVFKYANFAVANWAAIAPWLGVAPNAVAIATIPLPLGISFFTFHAISYVVDVYKRNAAPERSLPTFALYILLFPQLIAGPIIRWRDIATQLVARRERARRFRVRRAPLRPRPRQEGADRQHARPHRRRRSSRCRRAS